MDHPLTESPSGNQSMKGRFAIQECSQLELKTTRNETGLWWSLPDEVAVDILAQVSRLDLVALAMVSRRHRSKPTVVSPPPSATSAQTGPFELASGPGSRILFRADGLGDLYDRWTQVFDMETGTWDLLFVFTPKMPLKIQQSVVLDDDKNVYAVDEDGETFSFSPSNCMLVTHGITESNPENRNDWLLAEALFCRGVGGRILWRLLNENVWKEVKGLEELQKQHCGGFDIIKLCPFSAQRVGIFWEARPQGPDQILELWYAELSLTRRQGGEGWGEVWVNIEWSGAVLSHSGGLNLLCAASLYA
ncbi:unnamed protein product [Arabidopsis arenosa]|uniref:F-box domain-containing protein n=1 Tax=Arabidopsis arenosa TaxID=38785 RepID=A0A8S2A277_ARAAE|nr:unnamed protein product [Arabidopsis arenosa]